MAGAVLVAALLRATPHAPATCDAHVPIDMATPCGLVQIDLRNQPNFTPRSYSPLCQ